MFVSLFLSHASVKRDCACTAMSEQKKAAAHRKLLRMYSARALVRISASRGDDPERSRVERVDFIRCSDCESPLASRVPTQRKTRFFSQEKNLNACDCPETGVKRRKRGHI